MSTYLELCRDLVQECGINNSSTIPSAVTSQTGEMLRVVNWIKDSWTEIQTRHANWRWMRCGFTVNTSSGDDTYAYTDCTDVKTSTAIARFASWWAHDRLNPFKCYLTSGGVSGQYRLLWMPYEHWKRIYKFGPQQSLTGQPIHVSVDDDNQIVLGPKPDNTYTVTGDFQRGVQVLAADSDTPDMPSRFHKAIVWRAMMKFGRFDVASECYEDGRREFMRTVRGLEADQLPAMRLAGAMA